MRAKAIVNRTVIAAVNRLAHQLSRAQYERTRALLMAELETAKAGGATVEEMLALLADRARQAHAR